MNLLAFLTFLSQCGDHLCSSTRPATVKKPIQTQGHPCLLRNHSSFTSPKEAVESGKREVGRSPFRRAEALRSFLITSLGDMAYTPCEAILEATKMTARVPQSDKTATTTYLQGTMLGPH